MVAHQLDDQLDKVGHEAGSGLVAGQALGLVADALYQKRLAPLELLFKIVGLLEKLLFEGQVRLGFPLVLHRRRRLVELGQQDLELRAAICAHGLVAKLRQGKVRLTQHLPDVLRQRQGLLGLQDEAEGGLESGQEAIEAA